jgi:hypothetical protein
MRKVIIMCCLLMATSLSFAQVEFMHSLGGKYLFYSNSDGMIGGAALYSPRINLSSGGNSTFSVGTHFGLGFSGQTGPQGSSSSFILDVPLVGEYNFGFGSTKDAEGGFGGYLGAGYGIHHVSSNTDYSSGSASIHGPVFDGGVRFLVNPVGAFEVGASYMLDLKTKTSDAKLNIFGISVSYLFGYRER